MVWPNHALVISGVADLRAAPDERSELVDQAHFGENTRVLGALGSWRYVQGPDQYLGWIRAEVISELSVYGRQRVVARLLADLHEHPDPTSPVLDQIPAGTVIPETRYSIQEGASYRSIPGPDYGGWLEVQLAAGGGRKPGYIAPDDVVDVRGLPHRPPIPDDLIRTARAFLGVPYLWGGTTARGLDCSGFVQQVYRLNGVALPRDADQQAMLGTRVDDAQAGDLLFFGADAVTHVAIATGPREFLHAPMKGGVVGPGQVGGDRQPRLIRRYLRRLTEAETA